MSLFADAVDRLNQEIDVEAARLVEAGWEPFKALLEAKDIITRKRHQKALDQFKKELRK